MNRRAAIRLLLSAMAAPIAAVCVRREMRPVPLMQFMTRRERWSYVASYDSTTRTWTCTDCVNCHVGEDGKMCFPESAMTAPHSPVALT